MTLHRRIIADLIAAMLVMALFAFNFAHAAPVGPHDTSITSFGTSFCGGIVPGDDPGAGHAPCHACRIGNAAALPPPPDAAVPMPVAAEPVVYAAAPLPVRGLAERPNAQPRAPPVAA